MSMKWPQKPKQSGEPSREPINPPLSSTKIKTCHSKPSPARDLDTKGCAPDLEFKGMEALWNLEDKWKLSTGEAFLLFGCTAFAVVGLGAVAAFLRKARKKQVQVINVSQEPTEIRSCNGERPEPSCGWIAVKRVLMGSLRWSRASKWEERNVGCWGERLPSPLLALEGDVVGWQSHNSESPVWQRPILMGEKCEFPRFSGLILYDERGRPLSGSSDDASTNQEKISGGRRTTLKDIL